MKKLVKDVLFGDEREKGYCERQPSSYTTSSTYVQQATPVVYTSTPQTTYVTAPQTTYVTAPQTVVEHVERPAVIQEVIKPGVREEIQPVIHRDREQLEIREEIQPIYEQAVQPTVVEQRQLPSETRPEVRLGSAPIIAEGPRSSTVMAAEQHQTFTKPPIVEETVHKKIVEEITPVIHREVMAPKLIQEVKPIYEKVVDRPEVSYSTLPPVIRGEQQQFLQQQQQPLQQQQQFLQQPLQQQQQFLQQPMQQQQAPLSFQTPYNATPGEGGNFVREVKEVIIEERPTTMPPPLFQQK